MKFQAPRGTHDILPGDVERWQRLERLFHRLCARYGYREIRTPLFEATSLFSRSSGESSDIVRKQMYTFSDAGGDEITLRAEGTAPVIRAYLEHGLYGKQPVSRFYYLIPVFRYERPQAGRYRQHHQVGIELIGAASALADAEVICLGRDFLEESGISGASLHLNSIGCAQCRPRYREELRAALEPLLPTLCDDCHERYRINPLRVFDCKQPECQNVISGLPRIADRLCDACRDHFSSLQALLADLHIPFDLDPGLVRGMDYYTRTVFEFLHGALGAQNTVLGGGRYDGLVELMGGEPTPGIGFGCGLERVLLAGAAEPAAASDPGPPLIFVAALGDAARIAGFRLADALRKAGRATEMDLLGRSLKAQLREANRRNASLAIIIGDNELARKAVVIRDLRSSHQEEVPLDSVAAYLAAFDRNS